MWSGKSENKWTEAGDRMARILVGEVCRARTWNEAEKACDAIFHVRILQKSMEPIPEQIAEALAGGREK